MEKAERKAQASFRVYEVRDGIEFPIIDEAKFTQHDKENVLQDLFSLINKLCKYWNIDQEEYVEKHNRVAELEIKIAKKIQEKQIKDFKEFEAWKAKRLNKKKNPSSTQER